MNLLSIYAIYSGGMCIWVGITSQPKTRWYQHRYTTTRGIPDAEFNILRLVDSENGPRIELQIMRSYLRRGHPLKNKAYHPLGCNPAVKCKETGEVFYSYASAGRSMGVAGLTIANSIIRRKPVTKNGLTRSFKLA